MKNTPSLQEPLPIGALAALWQSGGEIDVEPLMKRLQRQNRRLRQLNQLSLLVCIAALVFLIVLEFSGKIPTRGLLSLIGAVSVAISWWKYRRDKARLIAAYSEEPARLLPFLIKRTRAMRNLGRYYYLTPFPSFVTGILMARFLWPDTDNGPRSTWFVLLAIFGLFALGAITIWGLRIARTKTAELKELESLQANLVEDRIV